MWRLHAHMRFAVLETLPFFSLWFFLVRDFNLVWVRRKEKHAGILLAICFTMGLLFSFFGHILVSLFGDLNDHGRNQKNYRLGSVQAKFCILFRSRAVKIATIWTGTKHEKSSLCRPLMWNGKMGSSNSEYKGKDKGAFKEKNLYFWLEIYIIDNYIFCQF